MQSTNSGETTSKRDTSRRDGCQEAMNRTSRCLRSAQ